MSNTLPIVLTRLLEYISTINSVCSDYVRTYFDVKKRAFLRNYMRDFGRFYAKFLIVNRPRHNRCEIRALP